MKTLADLQQDWQSILGNLNNLNSAAADLFKSKGIRPTYFEGPIVTLSCRKTFYLDPSQKAEHRKAIEQILTNYLGKPVQISVEHNPDLEMTQEEKLAEDREREEENRIVAIYDEKRQQEHLDYLKANSRIPAEDFDQSRFEDFEILPGTREAYEAAKAFADEFETRNYHVLTLVGNSGLGKTHLAKSIAIQLINKENRECRYYPVADLLDDLRAGLKDGAYIRIMDRIKDKWLLLILDDLGLQKDTDWGWEKLDQIINFRIENGCDLIVTTNKTSKELSARIASRLQMGDIVVMKGNDYRPKKATKLRQNPKRSPDVRG